MLCKFPITMRHPKEPRMIEFPCGQCLPCRIRKKSQWTLRNLLESRLAVSSSFWTLTFRDNDLHNLHKIGRKQIIYRFLDALRKSETRAGNSQPIRLYGCYELGGTLGRPHYHMLIYNMIKNYTQPTKYIRNLPRPRYHTKLWPYGHVDIGEYNPATVNYTIEYLMKDTRTSGAQSFPIRTARPAIGYYGLRSLAESLARKHGTLPELPVSLKLDGRSYPLDRWSKDVLRKHFKKNGGTFTEWKGPIQKKLRFLQTIAEFDNFPHIKERITKAQQQKERMIEQSEIKKATRTAEIEQRALRLSKGPSVPDGTHLGPEKIEEVSQQSD